MNRCLTVLVVLACILLCAGWSLKRKVNRAERLAAEWYCYAYEKQLFCVGQTDWLRSMEPIDARDKAWIDMQIRLAPSKAILPKPQKMGG